MSDTNEPGPVLPPDDPRMGMIAMLTAAAIEDHEMIAHLQRSMPPWHWATINHLLASYVVYLWRLHGTDPQEAVKQAGLYFQGGTVEGMPPWNPSGN